MGHVNVSLAFMAAFAFLIAYAVTTDVSRLTIPNWVSVALVGLFAGFLMLGSKELPVLLHAGVATAVLLLGFALFATGVMGAGDVKLMAAVALWAGPEKVLVFLMYMSLTGAALALLIMVGTFCLHWNGTGEPAAGLSRLFPRWVRRGLTPYGFAIGVGALLTVPTNIF
jgi:prepilin peptidase CpaA